MKLAVTIEIVRKEKWYLARIPELDFGSQGRTPGEARENVLEMMRIQFGEMRDLGTLEEYLAECGFSTTDAGRCVESELVGFEKSTVTV
ncbi:MAG: hypothetical protein A3K19_07765 [Lentisphaerae bacterium RIFOXYB12_FULL_65_16]|nr:MAG: hypothetical protein A3K18_07380 [Lentisphaerae bacterium RIFOXYA12_64_32]OGV87544.1 MAG: hypothetical protein A3K19_07765 [Lentisphaerae bacterium RIFOXYB12_FULL_65_16]